MFKLLLSSVLTFFILFTFLVSRANAQGFISGSPRTNISQIDISSNSSFAQVGEDIDFTVTIKNNLDGKRFIKALCFQSTDGNFGCHNGINLNGGQVYSISNSGRWTSGGTKSIWITWTPDGVNYYLPLDSASAQVFIFQ